MEFIVEGNSRKAKFLSCLMPSIIEQLGLTNSRKFVFVHIENTSIDEGFCQPVEKLGAYLIVIKANKDLNAMGITLAHEMVHVRQMAKGILKSGKNGQKFWTGKKYSKNTPYLDMPWECDAYARQELIYRRALEIT